ncbi:hypothetical protein [Tenacibaculum ovolyticum]|uniref:hypothetical protein n=1 Tax=Tenacibaculum ovolyticum TaxID=104270 RepID=UPI0007EC5D93|nr:hypothetical protein [Tenacibaculum ovolyticum]
MKFHITAILVNIILVFGIMHLYSFFVTFLDTSYFVKKGQYFDSYFAYSILVFSWLATFIIYKNKKYRTHYFYFVFINLLLFLIITTFKYVLFINSSTTVQFKIFNLFISIKDAILETIIPLLIISVLVNLFQNIIGKKLLPRMYEKY